MEQTQTTSDATAPVVPVPETQPATEAAVKAGDTSAFRVARRAERMGKPLEAVPVAASAEGAVEAAEPPVPRKARDDHYISERIREGVDRGTSELRSEIERLKQQVQAHPPAEARREPAQPYDGTDPRDAKPRAETFDDHEQYLDARDEWNERRIERKQARAAAGASHEQRQTNLQSLHEAKYTHFTQQMDAAIADDPSFVEKLSPQVKTLRPRWDLAPNEQASPLNVLGDEVWDSMRIPAILLHFSAHPEAIDRLIELPAHIKAMPEEFRAHHHINWIVKEFGKLEATLSASETVVEPTPPPAPSKTLTSAPPPAQTLGTKPAAAVDPKAAAVKSGNTQAYRDIRRRERAEQMAGR